MLSPEMVRRTLSLLAGLSACLAAPAQEWPYYGGGPGGTKYSPLDQINRSNVTRLKPVWIFDSGDFSDGTRYPGRSAFETTPIVVDGVMYVATSFHRLFALDAASGKVLWQFDPRFNPNTRVTLHFSRGVAYWTDGKRKRILLGDQQARLFSVDAATGKPDRAFGEYGMIDMKAGVADRYPATPYGLTSPVTVCGDTFVAGAWVADGEPQGPAGDIRGFDVRTGRLKWTFHTVPRPGEFGHDTWGGDSWKDRAGVNGWTIFSADLERRTVFVPLTSPATDFYGGDRPGANLFGDSLVALDCDTGRRKWHFQTIHHNLWDYDLPAQPVLVTLLRGGRKVDAVVQIAKTGFVFVLDRETGQPLFEIEERPIEPSPVPGERTWPTQPFPLKPPPFARQSMRLSDLTTVTPESRKECEEMIRGAEVETDLFPPILERMTVMFPGTNGGANWGGGSWDASTYTLYVNSMDVAAFVRMVKRPEGSKVPYRNQSFGRFWDSRGYPCQQPPWGNLTAIDLNKGEFRWRSLLGEFDELTARGVPKTGTPNLGGSIVTAGGLVFIAATNDSRFRAFDKDTGEELWTFRLPASGHATPMTYRSKNGRQFVAIAAGGGNKYNKTFDSKLVMFALPRPGDPPEPALVASPRKAGPPLRAGYAGIEEKLPGPAIEQPVSFSHRVHAATGTNCIDCHRSARTQARAGIPNAAACMICHRAVKTDSAAVQAVKRHADRGTAIDWRRVYQTPDFVFFSHQRHAAGGVACADCHGPVETRDVLAKEASTGMAACMNCHRQRGASNDCNVCHELGQ